MRENTKENRIDPEGRKGRSEKILLLCSLRIAQQEGLIYMSKIDAEILKTVIPTGRNHAVSMRRLQEILHIQEREVRKVVRDARIAGELICSDNSGYYYAENREELQTFVDTMEKKAKGTFFVIKNARRKLKEMETETVQQEKEAV